MAPDFKEFVSKKKRVVNKPTKKSTSGPSRAHTLRRLNKNIDFDREAKKSSARKRPTEVRCCLCKHRFISPFKPRHPEIYCDECFKKVKKKKFSRD